MNDFLKQDIFFFVTTIAVVVFTICLIILLIVTIRVVNDIKYITKKAKEEADLISQDLSDLRQNVKEKGLKFKYLLSFFNNLGKKRKE